jgi:hypothetical protein
MVMGVALALGEFWKNMDEGELGEPLPPPVPMSLVIRKESAPADLVVEGEEGLRGAPCIIADDDPLLNTSFERPGGCLSPLFPRLFEMVELDILVLICILPYPSRL